MGIDLVSMAMPLDADPVRAIRADPDLWDQAYEMAPFSDPWPDVTLPGISKALMTVIPAGTGWVSHFGDRSFQQAEYLLDPPAYRMVHTWEERKQTMPYRIIHGDEYFTDPTNIQEIPWRCSTRAFLTTAAQTITDLDVAAVRRESSVAEMFERGLYKVHPEEPDDQAFTRILAYLQDFSRHCHAVADQGLDLVLRIH